MIDWQDATVTSERDLWAVALWVEANRGSDPMGYIAGELERFVRSADAEGVDAWLKVADRYRALQDRHLVH